MATTPVEIDSTPGRTLTVDVFPEGNDTAAQSGISLTEETNRSGVYLGDITAAATGWHKIIVQESSVTIAVWDVYLHDNTDTHYVEDRPARWHKETDSVTELAAAPAATPSIASAIMWLFMKFRNKATVTADTETIYNDSGSSIATQALSDDGTTFTKQQAS